MNSDDLSHALVEGAIRRLSEAVGRLPAERGSAAAKAPLTSPLEDALARVLAYFGRPSDEVAVAFAAREEKLRDALRAVCDRHGLLARQVEIQSGDLKHLWGPILATRRGVPVLLVPGIWRRWRAVGIGAEKDGPVRAEELDSRAYSFSLGLGPDPISVRNLWRELFGRDNRRDLWYAAIWGVAAAAVSASSVYLIGSMVDGALPEGDRRSLDLLAAGWCAAALTASNLRLSRALLQARIGTRLDVTAEAALVGRTLSLPVRVFKSMAAGDLGERIRGACLFGKSVCGTSTDVVLAAVIAVAYGALLAATSWQATFAVLAVSLVRAVVGGGLLSGMYFEGRRQATARGKMGGRLFEILSGIARIKVAGAEARAFYQWAVSFAVVRRAAYKASLYGGALVAGEGLFDVLGTIVLYFVCCARAPGETAMGIGAFVVANACLAGIQAAYSDVVRGLQLLLPMLPQAERMRPLLRESAEVSAGAASVRLDGEVSLRNVTFHYAEDDVRILDDISLDIQRGESVAIVGPSGCGKSTVVKMILGFYPPSSGSILLDGKELGSLDLRSVRSQMGAVLQGSELLPSSILFNIVGTSGKVMDDAWAAARRARIADDIEKMPMKMFTMLSDRAVTISGGQKQRILIARALVREPKLLIFDEATSALDNGTQAAVMAALEELDCTKICIAHRLSTVVRADRIIVMDKGAIVQQGKFDELVRRDGLFRTMALRQMDG